jgi:hypothetical protein
MKRFPPWLAVTLPVLIPIAPTAHAETSGPALIPRFTFIELGYPQIAAASVGLWALPAIGGTIEPGLVADVEGGLSGAKVALGVGATSSPTAAYESVFSGGLQAVALRTWPGWSPLLPTSTTYAGVEAFGHFFAFRCSAGVMWRLSASADGASAIPTAGCGIGLP